MKAVTRRELKAMSDTELMEVCRDIYYTAEFMDAVVQELEATGHHGLEKIARQIRCRLGGGSTMARTRRNAGSELRARGKAIFWDFFTRDLFGDTSYESAYRKACNIYTRTAEHLPAWGMRVFSGEIKRIAGLIEKMEAQQIKGGR